MSQNKSERLKRLLRSRLFSSRPGNFDQKLAFSYKTGNCDRNRLYWSENISNRPKLPV